MNNVNFKIKSLSAALLLGLGLAAVSTSSFAAIESEANGTFANSDFGNPGSNSGVIGDLSAASNDVDIWRFDLTAGAGFGASISDGAGADFNGFDPLIVLYMENGGNYYAVAGNDPFAFTTSFGFTAWESGTYFLTVSAFGNSPEDAFGNNGYDSQFWSDENFGLGTPFSGFEGGSFASFDYNLSLNGTVATTVVPVPAAVWLFGSGLIGLVGAARRSRRNA